MSNPGVFEDPFIVGADSIENSGWSPDDLAAWLNQPGGGAEEDLIGSLSLHDWAPRITGASGNSSSQWSRAKVRVVDEIADQTNAVDRIYACLECDGRETDFLQNVCRTG